MDDKTKLIATKIGNNYGGTYVDEYTVKQEKTLRDEFAMMAMNAHWNALCSLESLHGWSYESVSAEAYKIADAMLKVRNGRK